VNKEHFSNYQGFCVIVLFLTASAVAYPTAPQAGRDLWLSIIFAILFSIPVYLIYGRLQSSYPELDLFEINENIFGSIIGKLLSLLFVWFAFHLGTLVISGIGEFVITLSFPETPKILPMIFMLLLAVWVSIEGMEVLSRWSTLFLLFNVPLPIISILFLLPQMDFNNIFPVMDYGIMPVLQGTLSAFSFPFGEGVVVLMALFYLNNKKSYYKVYLTSLMVAGIVIFSISLTEILVLGPDLYLSLYSPNFDVGRKISAGDVLQNLDIIIILSIYTATFVKLSVCLMAVSNGISKIFGFKDYRFLVVPVALLMLNNGLIMYDNLMEIAKFDGEIWLYYAPLFQFVLPLIILLASEIKVNAR